MVVCTASYKVNLTIICFAQIHVEYIKMEEETSSFTLRVSAGPENETE